MLNRVLEELSLDSVAPSCDAADLRAAVAAFDFDAPGDPLTIAERVIDLLKGAMVHTMHPGYFGLFNRTASFPGILADLITAHLNPQLVVWSHAPAPIEIEKRVDTEIGTLFGWSSTQTGGHFTSGGSEANHTAVLLALTHAAPKFAEEGTSAFTGAPRLYASADSHLAWLKIAHAVGVGRGSVRLIGTDGKGRISPHALRAAIESDLLAGCRPLLNAGMIDPIDECAVIATEYGLWLHVDAAWGGAVAVLPEGKELLAGIDHADSTSIDAHKWLSVPMGAGVLLCRHPGILSETFRVVASDMPAGLDAIDPYTHSMQCSRRFIGLKLILLLACMGWAGNRMLVRHSLKLSAELGGRLTASDGT